MKISNLIKILEYELNSTGDSDIYISIDTGKNGKFEVSGGDLFTTKNLTTTLDILEGGRCELGIKNWSL